MPPKKETAAAIKVRPDALQGKSVIITGEIPGRSRKAAEQILVDAGAKIEKSLNKKVQLVVLGENAGPSKMDKIESLGIETQEWDEVIEEIKIDGDDEPAIEDDDDEGSSAEEDEEVEEKPKPKKAAPKPKPKAATPAPATQSASSASSSSISGKKVIITGTIPGHDRKSAQSILENAGAHVEKSLNKQVQLVILGQNAGPDKLKKVEDMSIDTIEWEDLAKELDIKVEPPKKVAHVDTGDAPDSIDGQTLIITGTIEGQTRAAAQKLLESAGAKFAKSLNKSVQLVVLGAKPGPDKLAKIEELGIPTCEFESLVEKLGLQSGGAEPPKKKARKN